VECTEVHDQLTFMVLVSQDQDCVVEFSRNGQRHVLHAACARRYELWHPGLTPPTWCKVRHPYEWDGRCPECNKYTGRRHWMCG